MLELEAPAHVVCDDLRLSSRTYIALVAYALTLAVPIKYVLGVASTENRLMQPGPLSDRLAGVLSTYLWAFVIASAAFGPVLDWMGIMRKLPAIERRRCLWRALLLPPILIALICIARIPGNSLLFFAANVVLLPVAWTGLYSIVQCFIAEVLPDSRNAFGVLISAQAGAVLFVLPLTLWGTPNPTTIDAGPYYAFLALALASIVFPVWYRSHGHIKSDCPVDAAVRSDEYDFVVAGLLLCKD